MNEEKDLPEDEKFIMCSWCNGTGENWTGSFAPCPKCGGQGVIKNPALKEEN